MDILRLFEIAAIIFVSCLMAIFAGLYFALTRRQKKLNAAGIPENNITPELAEQLQIMHAQLDLICELNPAFTVCYDYTRECFSISENGRVQLGLSENADQKNFEDLIHPDDIFIYEEVTEAENIRKAELADSPYILKLRRADSQKHSEYLARLKPVYDSGGISAALVIALINTDYLIKGDNT